VSFEYVLLLLAFSIGAWLDRGQMCKPVLRLPCFGVTKCAESGRRVVDTLVEPFEDSFSAVGA
jgi:hypothetical protein